MTREDIIQMAQKAGFVWLGEYHSNLEDFAKLVAQHEREACAGIVVNEAMQYAEPVWAFEIVNDIKARGQA
jgi:hypothetical protein